MLRMAGVAGLAVGLAGCAVYEPLPAVYPAYPAYPPPGYYAVPAYPAYPPVYGSVNLGFGFGGGWHHHRWH
jgi:hypothetical protein